MSVIPAMMPMLYGAFPPEVNTARLLAGAGAEPMYQAAAGWEALAISLETQAEELAAGLVHLKDTWQGSASDRAVEATSPMIGWLRSTALQAQKRAMQAVAQASAYAIAMAATPPLPEIEMNHVTHATLEATNFLGINTAPIGVNEADYFVRMWNQAADAMTGYQAETAINTVFEPIPPMTAIVVPGVGESAAVTAVARNAALLPASILREATFAQVTADGQLQSVGLKSGNLVSEGNAAARRAEGRAGDTGRQGSQQNQLLQMVTQMASQATSMVGQLPQQLMQSTQQLAQPLQQATQMFSQLGSSFGSDKAQVGLIGASPLSNHPLAGGTGAESGAGLVRAAALPGLGGTATRSPLLAHLVEASPVPEPVTSGTGAGTRGGLGPAPVSGGSPMGALGERGRCRGSRPGLSTPTPLPVDDEDDDG